MSTITHAVLVKAKSLIPDVAHWSTDSTRVNGAQMQGYGSYDGSCFCAVGAIAHASGAPAGRLPAHGEPDTSQRFNDATDVFAAVIDCESTPWVEDWNDNTATFEALHAAFDAAIERAA